MKSKSGLLTLKSGKKSVFLLDGGGTTTLGTETPSRKLHIKRINQPRKSQLERHKNLYREGWKLEFAASVFTNDTRDEIAVVLLDGRFFRGKLVDEV